MSTFLNNKNMKKIYLGNYIIAILIIVFLCFITYCILNNWK